MQCLSGTAAKVASILITFGAAMPQASFAQTYGPGFDPVFGPVIRIASPANHSVFYRPVDVPIFAYTRTGFQTGGRYTNVEFFAGTNDLGPGVNLSETNRFSRFSFMFGPKPMAKLSPMWCFVWTNPPAGTNVLTAIARGPGSPIYGMFSTSAPVDVMIISGTNASNAANVVSIVAKDPIAVAGTNVSWVWQSPTNKSPAWTNWPPMHWRYYTNWGPKSASFTVRRFGDATSALDVYYSLGGTASNGVDYVGPSNLVSIPSGLDTNLNYGVVEIRAGAAYAMIPIVPIDNGTNAYRKTVTLTLSPPPPSEADYQVGIPKSAAGLILYNWLRPPPMLLPDGSFGMTGAGPDGAWFTVDRSSDLLDWSPAGTNQIVEGSIDFIDPGARGSQAGFYRVRPLTNAPPP